MEDRVLKVEVQESPLVTILRCSGRIVYGDGNHTLVKAVMSKDTRYFLIDLNGVTAIDAAGLGALAALERWARSENRTIHLANLSKPVREALEITGLSSVLQIFPISESTQPRRNCAYDAPPIYYPRMGNSSFLSIGPWHIESCP
jgi:anti-anti-sigma factor